MCVCCYVYVCFCVCLCILCTCVYVYVYMLAHTYGGNVCVCVRASVLTAVLIQYDAVWNKQSCFCSVSMGQVPLDALALSNYVGGRNVSKSKVIWLNISSAEGSIIPSRQYCILVIIVQLKRGTPRRRRGIILRWIFRKWDVGVWTGMIWLRIGTGGGHLWMR